MSGHTSIIHIQLEVKGKLFKVTNLGPGFFHLVQNPMIPAGPAKLHVIVEGEHDIDDIFLEEEIPENCSEQVNYIPFDVSSASKARLEDRDLVPA